MEDRHLASDKKKAQRIGAYIVFVDESGFSLIPPLVHTWAEKGHTPHILIGGHWEKISAISALVLSAKGQRIRLLYRLFANKNIRLRQMFIFLAVLLRTLHRPCILIWDNGRVHIGKAVRIYVQQQEQHLSMEFLPKYAPELNPDEFVWTQLKHQSANALSANLDDLRRIIVNNIRRLRSKPKHLRACFAAAGLRTN